MQKMAKDLTSSELYLRVLLYTCTHQTDLPECPWTWIVYPISLYGLCTYSDSHFHCLCNLLQVKLQNVVGWRLLNMYLNITCVYITIIILIWKYIQNRFRVNTCNFFFHNFSVLHTFYHPKVNISFRRELWRSWLWK